MDIELDGNSLLVPSSNHYDLSRTNSRISSVRSLCSTSLDISSPVPLSPVGSVSGGDSPTPSQVVKRDTVVNSFDLQPSVFENGKFHNPWPDYKAQTFTSILKLGFSPDKSNVSSKQVTNGCYYRVTLTTSNSPQFFWRNSILFCQLSSQRSRVVLQQTPFALPGLVTQPFWQSSTTSPFSLIPFSAIAHRQVRL